MTTRDVDIPSDPAGYISGPTRATSSAGGGTNQNGGVTIVEPDAPTEAPAETPAETPAPPA